MIIDNKNNKLTNFHKLGLAMKVAAIGDPTFVKGFELLGAYGFITEDVHEVRKILNQLVDSGEYALIILPERFVEETRDIRRKVVRNRQVAPIFSFIPDYTGVKGKRIEELKREISLAIGIRLKM